MSRALLRRASNGGFAGHCGGCAMGIDYLMPRKRICGQDIESGQWLTARHYRVECTHPCQPYER